MNTRERIGRLENLLYFKERDYDNNGHKNVIDKILKQLFKEEYDKACGDYCEVATVESLTNRVRWVERIINVLLEGREFIPKEECIAKASQKCKDKLITKKEAKHDPINKKAGG